MSVDSSWDAKTHSENRFCASSQLCPFCSCLVLPLGWQVAGAKNVAYIQWFVEARGLHSANPWMLCTFGPTFWPLLGHFEGNTSTLEKPTIFWNGNFCARSMPENGNGFFAHGFWVFALTLGLQDTWAGMPLTLLMRLGTCWCFKTREQSKLAPQSPFYTCRLQSLGGFQLASMEWALGCQLFYSCQLTPRGFHPSWVKHLDVLLMHCEMSKISQDMSEKANFFTHASWHLGGFNHYE